MDLYPTDEQSEIINAAAAYLARKLPADRMPKQNSTEPGDWQELADMGWFGLGLPEEVGGLGLSVVEEALVLREFGRNLGPPAVLATLLAGHLAAAVGDAELVVALISGRRRAGFALRAGEGSGEDAGFHLLDADGADLFVLWTPDFGLLAERSAFGETTETPGLDDSVQLLAAAALDPAGVLAKVDSENFQRRARVLTAAMLVGGAEATRDLSAEYAKVRQQFGHPIGVFQAIAFKCADMAVNCEASWAALQYAAVSVRDRLAEASMYSAAALMVAGEAALKAASQSMQLHGGYGQTYEYMPHFYLKRSHIYRALGGGPKGLSPIILDLPGRARRPDLWEAFL
jgi:alkylation response protein AidB-like acyl-CoA dehydrogenase